jgi:hypothetical protein
MAAPDTTKFQINYKLSDGTLINLYATDVKDLETGLTDLAMVAQLIKSTGADLGGSATASAIANLQSAGLDPVQVASGPAAVTTTATAQSGNACRHGAMVFKDGTNAQGKPWKAWMCPAPRGASDKCDPIWVR